MNEPLAPKNLRVLGVSFIAFAIYFNLPYLWLAANFSYPEILRDAPGEILAAFAAGGPALIFAWGAFALAALLFAPVAVGVAMVTGRPGYPAAAVAAIGVAAGLAQAIGLSRWVYAVPGLAASWVDQPGLRGFTETVFTTLHQFAGVGIGEAIGQTLTGFWLIGAAIGQRKHERFGIAVAALALAGGVALLFGLVEGLSTVLAFDAGLFGFAALVGYLILTVWLIWTGVLCIQRANTSVEVDRESQTVSAPSAYPSAPRDGDPAAKQAESDPPTSVYERMWR